MPSRRSLLAHVMCLALLAFPCVALAQANPAPDLSASAAADKAPISDAQLAQAVAPIALYPDELVSQILMASTYPTEIAAADQWTQANTNLKDDNLALALENQPWDASVKSLVNFPSVLSMLSRNLDATSLLGDAFLEDQKRVMDMIQSLRAKAKAAGNLSSNSQQTVTQLASEVSGPGDDADITITSADPQQIYVPTYDPGYVYGYWPYAGYPPYYWNPGYAYAVGWRNGVAWGYAWGKTDWRNHHLLVNTNQNIDNKYAIDRDQYKDFYGANASLTSGKTQWQHNPDHRDGAAYRSSSTTARYAAVSRENQAREAQQREAYRGRMQEAQAREARAQAQQQSARTYAVQERSTTAINEYSRGAYATHEAANRGYQSRGISEHAQYHPVQRYREQHPQQRPAGGGGRRR